MARLWRAASSAANQTRAQLWQESCGTVRQVLDSIQTLPKYKVESNKKLETHGVATHTCQRNAKNANRIKKQCIRL